MNNEETLFKETKAVLDSISPSMCFAKWKQTTLYLQTGENSSCHLPAPHKIPLEEIAVNPSALHNTIFKKKQQKQMLEGKKPSECAYCWRVQESSKEIYNDRITKSADYWALPYKDEILKAGTNDVNPSYLEVSFSNVCNLKCGYCNPFVSSKYMEEIKQFGPYPTSNNFNALGNRKIYLEREDNPYVDAFWKWWPNLYKDLKVFRITGGEPLLSKHTFKVLDYIIQNPNPNLELNINSNLSVPVELIENLIDKVKYILDNKLVKSFTLFTSCEAHGNKAEYIRFGLNYNKWIENCNLVLSKLDTAKLSIMAAYNALSVTSFIPFLEDIKKIKSQYPNRVGIDVPFVRKPDHLSVFILTEDLVEEIKKHVKFFEDNFQFYEINRMKKVYSVAKNTSIDNRNVARVDFCKFIDEHDRRRGTDFFATFPELEQFYYNCLKPL
jgi:organic radical activating enzyme